MLQLIKKEFIIQKKVLGFGLLYSIFILLVMHTPVFHGVAYIMGAFGISYMVILGTAQAEYKNNADIILNSLPIMRGEIVWGKYISVVIFAVMALVMVGSMGLLFHFLPWLPDYPLINLNDIVITLVSVFFLAAISLPTYFKSGARWAQVVNMLFFMMIFFAPAQVIGYVRDNGQQPFVKYLIYMAREQFWLLSFYSIALMLVLFYISYLISRHIYLNRDF